MREKQWTPEWVGASILIVLGLLTWLVARLDEKQGDDIDAMKTRIEKLEETDG